MGKKRSTNNAVGYVRISTDRDTETSTITQERAVREYADRQGWNLVGLEIDRGRSAFTGKDRPGLNRAMRMIESGAADTLIVWKLDRLVRSVTQFGSIWEQLESAGAEFVSVSDNFDTSTAMGRGMLNMAVVMAQLESDIKSDRIIAWQQYRLDERMAPTGPCKTGYRRTDDGEFVIDEPAAERVRKAARLLLDGVPLREIARRFDNGWTRRRISETLESPTIAGLRRTPDGELVEGLWEPVLDRDTWDAVQTILGDPGRRTHTANGRVYLLAGLVTCAKCDEPLRSKKQNATTSRYRCPKCGNGGDTRSIDERVEAAVLGLLDHDTWNRLRTTSPAVDVGALNDEANQLAEMYASGELTLAQFRTMNAGIIDRIAEVDNVTPLDLPDVDDLGDAWGALDLDQRRLVITAVTESITLVPWKPSGPGFDDSRLSINWRV